MTEPVSVECRLLPLPPVIWDWWDVQTKGQYAATLLALFLAVVFYRYLIRVELGLVRRTAAGGGVAENAELGTSPGVRE